MCAVVNEAVVVAFSFPFFLCSFRAGFEAIAVIASFQDVPSECETVELWGVIFALLKACLCSEKLRLVVTITPGRSCRVLSGWKSNAPSDTLKSR